MCSFLSLLVLKEDDNLWPEPDRIGEQQLEIKIGNGVSFFVFVFIKNQILILMVSCVTLLQTIERV